MKEKNRTLLSVIILIAVSFLFYVMHYNIFHDSKHIFKYLVADIAFLPIEVLLVSLVLHRLLEHRDKKSRLEKLNMIIGTFFTESGQALLKITSKRDQNLKNVQSELVIKTDCDESYFSELSQNLKNYQPKIDADPKFLLELRDFLKEHRDFFLSLLANPNLLEHETFTDLLMSVFHLTEELLNREELEKTSDKDREHLAIDIERAYRLLLFEWVEYMKHLKKSYPYLFSFALRTNPFDNDSDIEIK